MKVDALFAEGDGPTGGKIEGLECSECGQRFFEEMSEGARPRVLESAVEKFVQHAEDEHQASGGVIGVKRGAAA
jgi:uncharacterized radical SAM superfamily protein